MLSSKILTMNMYVLLLQYKKVKAIKRKKKEGDKTSFWVTWGVSLKEQ